MVTNDPRPDHSERQRLAERRVGEINALEKKLGIKLVPPSTPREDTPLPQGYDSSTSNDALVRDYAKTLGIGRAEDITPDERYVPIDATYLIEAGLFHKMVAEAAVVIDEGTGPLVFAGCRARKVTSFGTEKDTALSILNRSGNKVDFDATNEYEAALIAIRILPGFIENPNLSFDTEGPIKLVGRVGDDQRLIYLYDVPFKMSGKEDSKYNVLENTADQLERVLELLGKIQGAIVTSNTYLPSREGYVGNRDLPVVTYGSSTLEEVKTGTRPETPVAPSIAQILGELYRVREVYRASIND